MIGSAALRNAVWALLDAALAVPVYDEAPSNADAPHVELNTTHAEPWDEIDAQGEAETFQVDVWSRSPGWTEAKVLMQQVIEVLRDQVLALDEGKTALVFYERRFHMEDRSEPGVVWRHGVVRFRAEFNH